MRVSRSMFLWALIIISSFVSVFASEGALSNLLTNPGFESGSKSGWTGDGSIVSSNYHSGTKALALKGSSTLSLYANVSVTAGSSYQFAGWLKTVNITTGKFTFKVSWYNSSNVEITAATKYFGSVTTAKSYTKFSSDITAPANASKARFYLIASSTNGTGYFDDLSVIKLATPLVANSDSITTQLNTAVKYNVMTNDKGIDSGTVISLKTKPSYGQVVLSTDGNIVYTPNKDYFGSDSLIYQLTNKNGNVAVASVAITVNCVTNCSKIFGLSWSPSTSSNIIGYKVYVGRNSGVYDQVFDVTSTKYDYKALSKGSYYFAIKSMNSLKQLSAYSAEVTTTY